MNLIYLTLTLIKMETLPKVLITIAALVAVLVLSWIYYDCTRKANEADELNRKN